MTLQPQGAILPTFEELQMSCMRFIFSSFFTTIQPLCVNFCKYNTFPFNTESFVCFFPHFIQKNTDISQSCRA